MKKHTAAWRKNMEAQDLAGYKRLLAAIFGERPYGFYPSIVEEGKVTPLAQVMEEALASLPLSKGEKDAEPWKRGKRVLELRFGLKTKTHTLEEISALHEFRVTDERIRIIETKHLRMLRHPSRSSRLRLLLVPSPQEAEK